jgi:hypothetical protein
VSAPVDASLDSIARVENFRSAAAIDPRIAVRIALKAGVLGFFLSMILPLIGIVLAGVLAVYFYRQTTGATPNIAIGSRLGGATGIVVFAISTILFTVRMYVFHGQQEYMEFLEKFARTLGTNVSDPNYQDVLLFMFTPAGITITFILGLILTVLLSSAGGTLGAMFWRAKR